LDAYLDSWTQSRIKGLRDQAGQVLAEYATFVVQQASSEIRERAITNEVKSTLGEMQRYSRWSFGKDVVAGIVAALVWSLILIAIAVVLVFIGIDVIGVLQKIRPDGPG
jgi:hypothetical protein